jgi:hypothetical protein
MKQVYGSKKSKFKFRCDLINEQLERGTWNLVPRWVIGELTESEIIGITKFWTCPSSDVLENSIFRKMDLLPSSGEGVSCI